MIDSSLQLHRHGANLFLQSALRHQSGTLNFPSRHCRKSKRNGASFIVLLDFQSHWPRVTVCRGDLISVHRQAFHVVTVLVVNIKLKWGGYISG